jgi:hypothetical protein
MCNIKYVLSEGIQIPHSVTKQMTTPSGLPATNSVRPSIHPSIYLPNCPPTYPSIHPSIYLSIYLSMALRPFVRPWSPFQFLYPIHSRHDSSDGGSARRKAATYMQNNTNTEQTHTDIHALSGTRNHDPSVRRQFMP